ncbi:flagellar motor protein [Nitrosomonas sp. JL21]|nr:flagellar motor protein [Nitrosomonas sp.]MBL8498062.1 flagellar motor protein [Nitrosomonas sp.]MCC7092066.1 flagellar motor protein [Nitrosomonas sp.]MXS77655.1 flagellar motor protein [Nitrosomonas sp. JL21]
MDINSAAGIVLAFAAIIGGQILEGGHVGSLVQAAAFLIVMGGTIGAVLLQSPVSVFINGVKMSAWVFYPPVNSPQAVIKQIINWAQIARKEGLLALESHVSLLKDPFVKKGLQLLADGSTAEKLREALEIDISALEAHQRQSAKIWEAAGGYAPTIGILGAVLGLIHVMENLSDPNLLGSGIAVAFVATIYGVGFANLVCLPIANKLKSIISEQVVMQEILIDGLVAIANGENPRFIENRLKGYFPGSMV